MKDQVHCRLFREHFDSLDWDIFEPRNGVDIWRDIFFLYYSAFYPYFIVLLLKAIQLSKSGVASLALRRNLDCELTQDHAGLLRRVFIKTQSYKAGGQKCSLIVESIVGMLNTESSLEILAFLATLERASIRFIPIMQGKFYQITSFDGTEFRSSDLRYFDLHGDADIEHSDDLERAIQEEIDKLARLDAFEYSGQEKNKVYIGINCAYKVLKEIFFFI
jgi:hypothetical protein